MQLQADLPDLETEHAANMEKLPALGVIAGRTPSARLNPKLYAGRPKVSFMVK